MWYWNNTLYDTIRKIAYFSEGIHDIFYVQRLPQNHISFQINARKFFRIDLEFCSKKIMWQKQNSNSKCGLKANVVYRQYKHEIHVAVNVNVCRKKPVSCRDNKVWYEAGYCRYIHR